MIGKGVVDGKNYLPISVPYLVGFTKLDNNIAWSMKITVTLLHNSIIV